MVGVSRRLGRTAAALAATLGFVAASNTALADPYRAWGLDVSAGIKFDDRVTVDEADASAASDVAAVFGVDADYRLLDSDDSRIEIGYQFDQSIYQDFTAFDYQKHNPTLSAWTKTAIGVKLGLNYAFTHAQLGGSFFLNQHMLSPSISGFVADDVQVTAFYKFYDKDYADNNRDGQTGESGVDVHFFFDKSKKGYVVVGAGYISEDTSGTAFVYSGPTARATVQLPIDPFGQPGKLRFSYTYQLRDYDNLSSLTPPSPTGDTRRDDRQTLRAYGEVEIVGDLKATAEYRFTDRSSNLSTADYSKNVVSLGLEYGF